LTVDDVDAALKFFADAGGMRIVMEPTIFSGKEIEELLGAPEGVSLRTAVVSDQENRPTRLEILELGNVPVRRPRARPVGVKQVAFAVRDRDELARSR
jgi:hypothetical protein